MKRCLLYGLVATAAGGCSVAPTSGTLAELHKLQPDTEEVHLEDSLERAAQSYRRYLEETRDGALTPEAMRRMADLQIEQAFGIIGEGELVEMAAPERAERQAPATGSTASTVRTAESERSFEQRALAQIDVPAGRVASPMTLPDGSVSAAASGPQAAIETYKKILAAYPNYERNDQVLYQMSRAYDELGRPDEAIEVMERLIAGYPYSAYLDEVQFRRGEYYFVRKSWLDAEDAYTAIIDMGADSSYYELALYKMGWTLYKQEFYEEALHRYIAMLDHRLSIGYDFNQAHEGDGEHRIADTFRVISLSFSNLGGPDVIDDYFSLRGHRGYADRIYSNLGEFYFSKLRYNDAAAVYKSFIELNPLHRKSPHFSMRIVDIYTDGGFPKLVVESKKEFATNYALDAEYWRHFSADEAADVLGFLKTNLTDLANHYHARYQSAELADERPASFDEATHWYRQFLASFPGDGESPAINYQLADLLLENEDFGEAAIEYERTAYDYAAHAQAAAAGYAAVFAHRENLKRATGARQLDLKQATVNSSLRFADTFHEHAQAPVVLGAAADDLYAMQQYDLAISSARTLVERYPAADRDLVRSAWVVIAHSSIDIAQYPAAELAYTRVLALTDGDDESRAPVIDGLAAAIYKQGEQANLLEDHHAAAAHFLRIREVAPTSAIRAAAEYDAAAALIKVQDWSVAAGVLEDFRSAFPEHDLSADATRQLAHVYREDGQTERSAAEHERIADETDDAELRREALLVAGELYEEAGNDNDALRVYSGYADEFPRPLDVALETRTKVAAMFKARSDYARYFDELQSIVSLDGAAGADRSDRSKFLAAQAALRLAERGYERFAELRLTQPFEKSLAEKQRRMDIALGAFENLVAYEVAEVTAAATYYIAEIYYEFSDSLLTSERPANMSNEEMSAYELVIEEEAYPFEERAIDVHQENFELLGIGVFNAWVQRSLDKLAVLMPGRFAKNEISGGYLGSIDSYAYRMPIAPAGGIGEAGAEAEADRLESASIEDTVPADRLPPLSTVASGEVRQ